MAHAKSTRISINELARLCGVSIATVSRALNGQPGMSDQVRQRVLDAAEQHDYSPMLASTPTHLIGVTVEYEHIFSSDYCAQVLDAIENTAFRHGYDLVLIRNENLRALDDHLSLYLKRRMISGLIMMLTKIEDGYPQRLAREKFPHVLLGDSGKSGVNTIDADNRQGAFNATRHLLDLGHRRIAFFVSLASYQTHQSRLEGYLAALEAAGLRPDTELIIRDEDSPSSFEYGYRNLDALLRRRADVTAIIAQSNSMLGILECLRQHRRAVPGDVSLFSFDEADWMSSIVPGISAVSQSLGRLGELAVNELVKQMKSPKAGAATAPPLQTLIPTQLVIRQSLARPKTLQPARHLEPLGN